MVWTMEAVFVLLLILGILLQSAQPQPLRKKSGFDPSHVTAISWSPRAFLYKGFLSEDECHHLIHLAKDKLEKSTVVDHKTGESVETEYRTSSGMFIFKAYDDTVTRIEARIAAWTSLPPENGEDMQILRYKKGQRYGPHMDYIEDDDASLVRGGNRIATVLMYLSNVEKGGETVFPNSEVKYRQYEEVGLSNCAKSGYVVKPRKGDALLFFSLHPNATIDPSSMHNACPVIKGEKWSATKWIHVRAFDNAMQSKRPSGCIDEHPNCSSWALSGECVKNLRYMVGINGNLGYCRQSCKACWLPSS